MPPALSFFSSIAGVSSSQQQDSWSESPVDVLLVSDVADETEESDVRRNRESVPVFSSRWILCVEGLSAGVYNLVGRI